MSQVNPGHDETAGKYLGNIKGFSENQPAKDYGKDRNEVDKGRRLVCRNLLDGKVVEPVGTDGYNASKIDNCQCGLP